MRITSTRNDRVKAVRRLHRARARRDGGLTILEGPHLVEAALSAGVALVEVWATDGSGDIECSDEVLASISTTETPQSPVAVMAIPDPTPLARRNTAVLWDLSDPGNVGTTMRTAAALGWAVAVTPATADPWSPKVLRAASGAHFAVALSVVDAVADLADLTTVATVVHGGRELGEVGAGPYGLLVGNESVGLAPEVVAAADVRVSIPIRGVESLNASVAAAIAMWELMR